MDKKILTDEEYKDLQNAGMTLTKEEIEEQINNNPIDDETIKLLDKTLEMAKELVYSGFLQEYLNYKKPQDLIKSKEEYTETKKEIEELADDLYQIIIKNIKKECI